jgi:oxygen-independent coproporphyrinogen-3 oxidase
MAGIYIHIPFCKKKCNYCDFYFSTNYSYLPKLVNALCTELEEKKNYCDQEIVNTVYFGGGTPSVLPKNELKKILDSLTHNYNINENAEVTFECNPDDITSEKLKDLKELGINRLSIGIQSFDNEQLVFMNRAHNANEALNCVKLAQTEGFDNITVDLIYGLPDTKEVYWSKQVKKALDLNVNHISAYCLTIEEKTVFGNLAKKGKLVPLADEKSLAQFKMLQSELKTAGFEHYEISNFAKNNCISKHNSAYWLGEKYIGIGPSAHSFNGVSRQWNVANNIKYIIALKEKTTYSEVEELSQADKFNEYILTRLRTKWGVVINDLFEIDGSEKIRIEKTINRFIMNGDLIINEGVLLLTDQGKFIADHISAELFI